MSKILEIVLVVISCTVLGFKTNSAELHPKLITESHSSKVKIVKSCNTINTLPKHTKDTLKPFKVFLEKLAWRESRGNWKIVNRFGYMGKYQIGKLALKDIGMDSITSQAFRKDSTVFPEYLQDIAIRKYIKKNRRYLKNCIESYKDSYVNDIYITESGIIGAAHLVGQRSVKEWLNCGGHIRKVDGNGVTIESYLKLFSGYKII
jgi:hypothetical protein